MKHLAEMNYMFCNKIIPNVGSPHLDYGCKNGLGTNLLALQCRHSTIVGYDQNQEMIQKARENRKENLIHLTFTDTLEYIPQAHFKSASANLVYHEDPKLFQNIYPLMAMGGKIVVLDHDLKGISTSEYKSRFNIPEGDTSQDEFLKHSYPKQTSSDLSDCIKSAREAGFKVRGQNSSRGFFTLIAERA